MKSLALVAVGATAFAFAPAAHATLTPVGVFVGDLFESFESFPTSAPGNNYASLPEGTSIMGGAATISSLQKDIFVFGVTANDGYGVGAYVKPAEGVKGIGTGSQRNDGITISFLQPITAFGGYFASYGQQISVSFSDGSTELFNYGGQNTGVMAWQGWTSDVGITSVSWTGEFVAADNLQANVARTSRVPDTGATAGLLGLALGGLAWFRRKFAV